MKQQDKLIYLEDEVGKSIKTMKSKGDQNKSRSFVVGLSSAILGAIVTISLGIQTTSFATELKNLALICGALIAVVNAFENVIGFRAMWIKQKATLSQLYTLRNEIQFYKAGLEENDQINEEHIEEFFEKYQGIWEADSNEWLRLRREQEQESGNKGN